MRHLLPHLVVASVFWLVPATLVAILHSTLPATNSDGNCAGIGWGCSLPPAEAVVFFGLGAAPYLFLGGCLVMSVIAAVQWRRAAAREPVPWVEPDWPD